MAEAAWTGLDVGGAHLKVAQVDRAGRVTAARQLPCPLWRGLDRLDEALAAALRDLPPAHAVAVTMTGELVDLFPDRATGVRRLVERLAPLGGPVGPRFWAGRAGFLDAAAASSHPHDVASANWLATATYAARRVPDALLLDIGSTTSDVLVLAGGEPRPRAWTDRERLAAEELVYTGATRTPVMVLASEAPFLGERVPLMAEHFATTADVWRTLGLLPDDADQHPAADDGPKTPDASARRLARMVGADLADAPPAAWTGLARALAREQEARLLHAIERQLSRNLLDDGAPLIGVGTGSFIVGRLATALSRSYRDFAGLVGATPEAATEVSRCAPAVAVALLAQPAPPPSLCQAPG